MTLQKRKTILVTGATGIAGGGLIDLLLQNNYIVFALSRVAQPVKNKNLNWIKFDMLSDSIENTLKKIPEIDGVVHAAAYVKQENRISDIENNRKINIEFSDNLFKHFSLQNTSIPIIYISSIGFMKKPLNKIITELDDVAPNIFYHMAKYWGELSLMEYSTKKK